jgi:hypothetical protein
MERSRARWSGFFVGLCALAMAGCVRVPAGRINTDRMDFGQVIQQSWKRQTLLNIVRMRYADAPMFLDVASVINSYSLGGSASGGASLEKDPAANSFSLGAGGYWSNTPTVTYQPLMGDRFTRSLLQPVAPAAIFQLMQGGLSPDLVLATLVRSINGLRNDSFGVAGDPGFHELVDALARIQRAGALGNRLEARKDGSALILIFRRESEGEGPLRDVRRVRELLGLEENISEIEVVFGLAPRTGSEIAIVTRTMLGIITELAMDVEVPAVHLTKGWSFSVPLKAGDARAATRVRVRSGEEVPENVYVAVPYEGYWYWIDKADLSSKRTFTFLLILFSLAETGQAAGVPVVTVPSR